MSNSVCMLHTDRAAAAACSECGRPLCEACTQIVAGKPLCQTCVAAIRARVSSQLDYPSTSAVPSAQPSSAAPAALPAFDFTPHQPVAPPAQPGYGQQPGPGPAGYNPYGAPPQSPPQQPGYNPYGAAQPASTTPQPPYGAPPGQQSFPGQQQQYGQGAYAPQPAQQVFTPPPAAITPGNYILGFILGLIASIVGACIYVGVVYATHFSIGYMALGLGFLVGWAVKFGTRVPSRGAGIMAVVLTVISLLPKEILFYHDPSSLLFTALFLFIGCRWAYSIAASGS